MATNETTTKYVARKLTEAQHQELQTRLEAGDNPMSNEEMIDLFQHLLDTGELPNMSLPYTITALAMLSNGDLVQPEVRRNEQMH